MMFVPDRFVGWLAQRSPRVQRAIVLGVGGAAVLLTAANVLLAAWTERTPVHAVDTADEAALGGCGIGGTGPTYRFTVTLVNQAAPSDRVLCTLARSMAAVYHHRLPEAPAAARTEITIYPTNVPMGLSGYDAASVGGFYSPESDQFTFSSRVLTHPDDSVPEARWIAFLAAHEAAHRWQALRGDTFATVSAGYNHAHDPHEVAAYREGITVATAIDTGLAMDWGRNEPNGDVTLFSPFANALPAYRAVLATGPRYVVVVHHVHSWRTWLRDRIPARTRRTDTRENGGANTGR